MNIVIPPAIVGMTPELTEFFEGMVHKLNVNSHKDAIRSDDIDGLLAKMQAEIQEFRDQRIADASDANMLSELHDIGNFAFLLYAYLRSRGLKTMRERFLDEYFDVSTVEGRVYCRKTRPGSPLQPGEEVYGSARDGVRYIRSQSVAAGVSVSVSIRDLVWWKHHGRWPERPLRYKRQQGPSLTTTKDCIDNLELVPEEPGGKLPFVFCYQPKGRENAKNYGRFGYQRRHAFKLVRVGYWDSAEEAAREGVKAWKAKVRETGNV